MLKINGLIKEIGKVIRKVEKESRFIQTGPTSRAFFKMV